MTPQQTYQDAEVTQLRAEKAQLQLDLEEIVGVNSLIRKQRDHAIQSLRFQRRDDAWIIMTTAVAFLIGAGVGAFAYWAGHS